MSYKMSYKLFGALKCSWGVREVDRREQRENLFFFGAGHANKSFLDNANDRFVILLLLTRYTSPQLLPST